MNPLAGRDWKRYPLTRDEARLLWARDREQRAHDWQSFKLHWPMHAFEFAKELCGGVLLGAALSLSLAVYVFDYVARTL